MKPTTEDEAKLWAKTITLATDRDSALKYLIKSLELATEYAIHINAINVVKLDNRGKEYQQLWDALLDEVGDIVLHAGEASDCQDEIKEIEELLQ